MKNLLRTTLISLLACNGMALAEVTDAAAGGFTTVNEVIIDASGDVVWQAAIRDVGLWWSSDHTISGDASRLRITAEPLGCFCESFGEGTGVVHLIVTMVNPGVIIRLTGGLGPLGLMGVSGNMTWEFEAVDEGSKVTFTYAVGGYRPEGLDAVAEPVDYVIGEALLRLKTYIETGNPEVTDLG